MQDNVNFKLYLREINSIFVFAIQYFIFVARVSYLGKMK